MAGAPVFIGGLHRSGTSLLRAIVGSHPEVALYERDLPLWTDLYGQFCEADFNDPATVDQLLEEILAQEKAQEAEIPLAPEAVRGRLAEAGPLDCGRVFRAFLEEYAAAAGRPRWGLKTPHNEFHAEAIFAAEPGAKMLHVLRDPRDVAVSHQRYKRRRLHYDPEVHIERWRESVCLAEANVRRYAGHYLTVRYEDLVLEPEPAVRRICAFLELDYRPELLAMSRQAGWQGSNSSFGDFGNDGARVSQAPVGRYKTQLAPFLRQLYQSRLHREMARCGYEPERFGPGRRLAFHLCDLSVACCPRGLRKRVVRRMYRHRPEEASR
jgi:hypothetical protein